MAISVSQLHRMIKSSLRQSKGLRLQYFPAYLIRSGGEKGEKNHNKEQEMIDFAAVIISKLTGI